MIIMKTLRKITHYFNVVAVTTCIVLALIYFDKALTGYFLLGLFQVTLTLILSVTYLFKKKRLKPILVYWLLVVAYFIFILRIFIYFNNEILGFLLPPILIAIYNCYLTYLNKE